ncbi:MAG: SDR family oxidoreductase [Bryobacteraceae bacterium]
MRVLMAGSTGVIGREIAAALRQRGHDIVCPTRANGVDALRPETLRDCCAGVAIVISAMGGSVALDAPERRGYAVTNTTANHNLLAEALSAGVRRFLYVAAHSQPGYAATSYMRSHEAFVAELGRSGLSFTALRPTAIFNALAPFVGFAKKGFVPLIGDGFARTNPISARDVARAAIENLEHGPANVSLGGPEILTRRGVAELAAMSAGTRPYYLSAPPVVARINGRIAGIFNSRMGELIEFAAAVSTQDCVAPLYGSDTLGHYFKTLTSA